MIQKRWMATLYRWKNGERILSINREYSYNPSSEQISSWVEQVDAEDGIYSVFKTTVEIVEFYEIHEP